MADTRGRRTSREEEKRGRRGGRGRKKKTLHTPRRHTEILGFMQRADLTVEQRKINRKKKKRSGSEAPERPQQGGVQEGFQGATLTPAL